jgi:hypothetical protein
MLLVSIERFLLLGAARNASLASMSGALLLIVLTSKVARLKTQEGKAM